MNDLQKLINTLTEIGCPHMPWIGNDARSMETVFGPEWQSQIWSVVQLGCNGTLIGFGEHGNLLVTRHGDAISPRANPPAATVPLTVPIRVSVGSRTIPSDVTCESTPGMPDVLSIVRTLTANSEDRRQVKVRIDLSKADIWIMVSPPDKTPGNCETDLANVMVEVWNKQLSTRLYRKSDIDGDAFLTACLDEKTG